MRLAILLFFAGIGFFLAADYFEQVRAAHRLVADQLDDPGAQAYYQRISDLQDGTTSATGERILTDVGYVERVTVFPGFRIIHDPELGSEVIVSGPENVLDYLNTGTRKGRFSPDFDRPVRLRELVDVRINLQAHGSRSMRIRLVEGREGRTSLKPDFVTEGPLEFQLVRLNDVPTHQIEIKAQDLVVYGDTRQANQLHGTAERLEFLYFQSENDSTKARLLEAPNLQTGEVIHTNISR